MPSRDKVSNEAAALAVSDVTHAASSVGFAANVAVDGSAATIVASVAPQSLDSWPAPAEARPSPVSLKPTSQPSSPAVAGLLRLRERVAPPPLREDIATGNPTEDAAWARELLAATRMTSGGASAPVRRGAGQGGI